MSARRMCGLRLIVAAAMATVAMGMAAGQATASRGLSVTNGVTTATANGRVTIAFSGVIDVCSVSLTFTLNRSFAKSQLAQIAGVASLPISTITNCDVSNGGAVLLGATVGFMAFDGGLPNVSGIAAQSNNFAFMLDVPILGQCLWSGRLSFLIARNVVTGAIESVQLAGSGGLISDVPFCSAAGVIGTLSVLPTRPVMGLV